MQNSGWIVVLVLLGLGGYWYFDNEKGLEKMKKEQEEKQRKIDEQERKIKEHESRERENARETQRLIIQNQCTNLTNEINELERRLTAHKERRGQINAIDVARLTDRQFKEAKELPQLIQSVESQLTTTKDQKSKLPCTTSDIRQ